MLWLFVGPTGIYLLDFFCSGIQFNFLLSPYPCFISLLYLDLYVLYTIQYNTNRFIFHSGHNITYEEIYKEYSGR